MLLERPDAVVAHHAHDVDAVPRERVVLHAAEAEGTVADEQHDLLAGPRELRGQRVPRPGPQAPERPRIEPAAGLIGVHDTPREGDEVAAVADHDRVAVEDLAELLVEPHGMQRGAAVLELGPLGRALLVLDGADLREPRGRLGAARAALAQRVEDRGQPAVELRRHGPRVVAQRLGAIDRDDLGLLAERLAEAQAEVHRHADHEREVRALQGHPARAGEEQLVVRRHAPARQAVEEHGDPALLGQRAQRRLAVTPVQVRPRHDHRPLGVAQERDRALQRGA